MFVAGSAEDAGAEPSDVYTYSWTWRSLWRGSLSCTHSTFAKYLMYWPS